MSSPAPRGAAHGDAASDVAALRVADLEKRFTTGHGTVEVLRGVSLHLAAGDAAAITGPSGSGKSTLLHVIGTLERPSEGAVEIDGTQPFALDEAALARFRNDTVGFVFQDHHLLPHFTVLENVLVPTLAFARNSREDQRGRARELLERVGLGHRLEHRPAQLSGGERQRVAVARAMINRPRLLLCDEPTGSLDQANAASIGDLLTELHQQEGTVLLVVTHSPELAARFERRFDLRDGRITGA